MKLENDNNSYGKFYFYLYASSIIAGLMAILYMVIKIIINGELKESLFFLIVTFFGVLLIIVWSRIFYDIMIGSMNIKRIHIKELGEKVSANIVSVGFQGSKGRNNYYITVLYKNKTKDICYIKNNKAYDILKLLLNPYPVKYDVKIPIDIYVYKNKIYADLESVELSNIDGYEDAKRAVEESYGEY